MKTLINKNKRWHLLKKWKSNFNQEIADKQPFWNKKYFSFTWKKVTTQSKAIPIEKKKQKQKQTNHLNFEFIIQKYN